VRKSDCLLGAGVLSRVFVCSFSSCLPCLTILSHLKLHTAAAIWSLACNDDRNRATLKQHGAIAALCGLLLSPSPRVLAQVVGALANLAWRDEHAAELLETNGAMRALLDLAKYLPSF
jgi:hypothetical protein